MEKSIFTKFSVFMIVLFALLLDNSCIFKRDKCGLLDCSNQLEVYISNVSNNATPQLTARSAEGKEIRAKCDFPMSKDTCICKFSGIENFKDWEFIWTVADTTEKFTLSEKDLTIKYYHPNGKDCPPECFLAKYYWTKTQ